MAQRRGRPQTTAGPGERTPVRCAAVDDDPRRSAAASAAPASMAPAPCRHWWSARGITDVLLALPGISHERRRDIIRAPGQAARAHPHAAQPGGPRERPRGRDRLQDLDIVDLLGRAPVAPDQELLEHQPARRHGARHGRGRQHRQRTVPADPALLACVGAAAGGPQRIRAHGIHQRLQAAVAAQQDSAATLTRSCPCSPT